ncbi:MAG: coenzyme F420 hydrogenase [SAR202 cluster bacterium]|nr:coenzyme F420 hydrogenase [SAR202 cluster bacterium]
MAMKHTRQGPLPTPLVGDASQLAEWAFAACPGKGLNYPELSQWVFGHPPEQWLVGCWRKAYVGFSSDPAVRRAGASAGVITQTLMHLLETGKVAGAVVVKQGSPKPWEAEPIIATTPKQVMECTQSVYVPVPVNTILAEMERFQGRLAYVGLPDQVASLRRLQQLGHPGALRVDYVLGPYCGMAMYQKAIESFLRANGVKRIEDVAELRYREGEWPGYLQVKTHSGKVLRAAKFYYNYLIPFYVTRSTLYSVDFTNELTDISVGDAWHPKYEKEGKGFSVVLARTAKGEQLLNEMQTQRLVELDEASLQEAMSMHGHMLDFKKRGAFIRMGWRRRMGKRVPDYGYKPVRIAPSRRLAEAVIYTVFLVCGSRVARRLVEFVPLSVLGPMFNVLRKSWKNMSKPTKRAGLRDYRVQTWPGRKVIATPEGGKSAR